MYKEILIPVALDNETDRVSESVALARKLSDEGAKITLLHIIETVPSFAINYIPEDILKATRQGIHDEIDKLATEAGVEGKVIDGHTGRSILEHAAANGSDLIIISSHRPGMQMLLLGSTATHVVRHATCAVHVLR